MRTLRHSGLSLGVILAALPAAALGAEAGGVFFADEAEVREVRLAVRGCGTLFAYGFVKVYAACFYLPAGVPAEEALAEVPRRLEIEYFRPITARDFRRATEAGVARNASLAAFERLRPALDALNALYRDVRPGDRYALAYLPGAGTTLSLNGLPLGTVPGAEFAASPFAIWLGDNPLDPRLKAALRGDP